MPQWQRGSYGFANFLQAMEAKLSAPGRSLVTPHPTKHLAQRQTLRNQKDYRKHVPL